MLIPVGAPLSFERLLFVFIFCLYKKVRVSRTLTPCGGLSYRTKRELLRLSIDSFALAAHALPQSSGISEARFSSLSQCHW